MSGTETPVGIGSMEGLGLAPGRVPACPFAVFDEFGKGADDRVQDYAAALVAAERDRCRRAVLSCCGDDVIGAVVLAVIDGAQDWQQEADGSWTLSA